MHFVTILAPWDTSASYRINCLVERSTVWLICCMLSSLWLFRQNVESLKWFIIHVNHNYAVYSNFQQLIISIYIYITFFNILFHSTKYTEHTHIEKEYTLSFNLAQQYRCVQFRLISVDCDTNKIVILIIASLIIIRLVLDRWGSQAETSGSGTETTGGPFRSDSARLRQNAQEWRRNERHKRYIIKKKKKFVHNRHSHGYWTIQRITNAFFLFQRLRTAEYCTLAYFRYVSSSSCLRGNSFTSDVTSEWRSS